MKEKLVNNLWIKILSICLAAFLWVVIVNVDDPVKTRTFTNVPVQVLNANTLTSKHKAFDIISGDTVDFMVSGKRSQLEKLKKTDFLATADLAQLTPPFDTVKINVECTKTQDIQIVMGKISTMTISLEDIVKESFSIKVDPVGNCAPGYAIGKAEVSPVILEVSGAESLIRKIADIKVTVDINGASSDVTKTVVPKAYNENGVEISSEKLTFSNRQVTAKVTIQNTKSIPVVIETTGNVADGYHFLEAAYEPQEIEVKGARDKLDGISSLPIPIDITGLTADKEYTISIHDMLLPYGVSVVDPELENLVVKVTIQKMGEKTFEINRSDIQVLNLRDGLSTEFLGTNTVYSVTLIGLENQLEGVSVEDLAPAIDLAGVGIGRHKLDLRLTYPEGISQKGNIKIFVNVVSSMDDEPVASEKPGNVDVEETPEIKPSEEPNIVPSQAPVASPEVPKDEDEETENE